MVGDRLRELTVPPPGGLAPVIRRGPQTQQLLIDHLACDARHTETVLFLVITVRSRAWVVVPPDRARLSRVGARREHSGMGGDMHGAFGIELMRARQQDIDRSVERARGTRRTQTRPGRARASGLPGLGADAVRLTFGIVWLVDASLKWLPGFRTSLVSTVQEAADGQPSWLHGWFSFWVNLIAPRASLFTHTVAVIETAIALALIFGFARKATYVLAIPFTLMIWATAEGFGGPYASGSSDIGTAVIYAVVFLALLVIEAGAEPSRYTVDAWLAERWPGWRRFAELGVRAIEEWSPRGSGREIVDVNVMEGETS